MGKIYVDSKGAERPDRRIRDTDDLSIDEHMARALNRFKHTGNPDDEDLETTLVENLREGEEFRTRMLKYIACKDKELSPERKGIFMKLKKRFDSEIVKTFDYYGDKIEGMPTWSQIEENLTDEVLDEAIKMEKLGWEPEIVVVSPHLTRQAAFKSISEHKVEGQRSAHFSFGDDDNLWNGGDKEQEKGKWVVKIRAGFGNIGYGEMEDFYRKHSDISNDGQCGIWVQRIESAGFVVGNDMRTHVAQIKQAFANGRCLDTEGNTILNARTIKKAGCVALSQFYNGNLYFTAENKTSYAHAGWCRAEIPVCEL